MATANQIAALISAWFTTAPAGLFGAVTSESDLTVKKDPAVVEWLDTAIAICLAESQGNPDAKNSGSSASGLWQVMVSVHGDKIADGIRWIETETGDDNLTIFDARVNTFVAGRIYAAAGNKWTPWEAYNTGAYKQYKGRGDKAFDWLNSPRHIKAGIDALKEEQALGKSTAQLGGALMPLAGGAGAVSNSALVTTVLKFLREGSVTIGVFLIGLVALALGVAFVVSAAKPAKRIVKANPIVKAVT